MKAIGGNNKILRVLSINSFLFLWLAEVFSQIAFNMMNFILLLVIFKLTNSNLAVSAMVLSFTIPSVLFGVLAGVYVDRWHKKNVLLTSNLLRVAILLLIFIFHTNIFVIYTLAFLSAVITQFFIPAETPMIPLVVKKDLLLSANALFGLGLYGSIFLAYALSGPFLVFFGSRYIFIVLAILFLIGAIFISLIKVSKKTEEKLNGQGVKTKVFSDIKSAVSLIVKTKKIYSALFLLTLVQMTILILATIGPGYAAQVLKIDVDEFPIYIVTPIAFGMLVASIIIGNFLDKFSRQTLSTIGVFLGGLTILALPFGSKVASKPFIAAVNELLPRIMVIDILHIMIFLAFVLGIANALVFVPSNTILQEETTDDFRGKVYGASNALAGISSFLPIVIVGQLADIFGVGAVLSAIGTILVLIGIARLSLEIKTK